MTDTAKPLIVENQISAAIMQADEIPQFGSAPDFPLDAFASAFQERLGLSDLTISIPSIEWQDSPAPLSVQFPLVIEGYEGSLAFQTSDEELQRLTGWILGENQRIPDDDIREAFRKFIAVQALTVMSTLSYGDQVQPRLTSDTPEFSTSLVIQIAIGSGNEKIQGQLVLSETFMKSWRTHYARQTMKELPDGVSESLTLIAQIEGGEVHLSQEDFKAIEPGDFLVLDRCLLSPAGGGYLRISVNGVPLKYASLSPDGDVTIQ